MRTQVHSPDDWQPCPPGSLASFAGKEQSRQRRRFLAKLGGVASVLLLVGGTAYLAWTPRRLGEPNFGGITCTEVRANGMAYMAGRLDAGLSKRIHIHLEQCPLCQKVFREMPRKMMGHASLPTHLRATEDCGCDHCRNRPYLAGSAGEPSGGSMMVLNQQQLAPSR